MFAMKWAEALNDFDLLMVNYLQVEGGFLQHHIQIGRLKAISTVVFLVLRENSNKDRLRSFYVFFLKTEACFL